MKKYLALFSFLFIAFQCFSQWSNDTLVRTQVTKGPEQKYGPITCSDSHGGIIIAWKSEGETYVQRLDSAGVIKWGAKGFTLSKPALPYLGIGVREIVSDKAGGAIIFYVIGMPLSANLIYAQRVNANGHELWGDGGISIANIPYSWLQMVTNAVPDENGGAFLTWQSWEPFAINAQHIDKNGILVWGPTAVRVTNADSVLISKESNIISTGDGTAVVTYSYDTKMYIQRIAQNGHLLWGSGVKVSDAFPNTGLFSQGIYTPNLNLAFSNIEGTKSIYVDWNDERNFSDHATDVYVQRYDLDGNALWQNGGMPMANSSSDDSQGNLFADNNGGVFMGYRDGGVGKMQRIDKNGTFLWGPNGIAGIGYSADDGNGGFLSIIYKYSGSQFYGAALYAQHYDINGQPQWREGGVPIVTGFVDLYTNIPAPVSLHNGYAIACWKRSDGNLYAAKFGGETGFVLPVKLTSLTATLQKNEVTLQWATAQEVNSNYFGVERSVNGATFAPLLTVPAAGTSNKLLTYTATDAQPAKGANYYRLKMVDKDGRYAYSNTVYITTNGFKHVQVYPNPIKTTVTIKINATAQKSTLSLYDAQGRLVAQKVVTLQNGENTITWNIQALAAGTYFLKSGGVDLKMKVVKE